MPAWLLTALSNEIAIFNNCSYWVKHRLSHISHFLAKFGKFVSIVGISNFI